MEAPSGLFDLLSRLRPLLSPDGRLIVIDTIPERLFGASVDVLRYDLSLALRTLRGTIHDRATYERAFAEVGLVSRRALRVSRAGAGVDALVAAIDPSRTPAPPPSEA